MDSQCGGMEEVSKCEEKQNVMTNNSPGIHWYALKVFFNKVFDIESALKEKNIECFIPCENVSVEHNGVKKVVRKPMVSSLLFFQATEQEAIALQNAFNGRVLLYTRMRDLRRTPVVIPEREMNVFMLVCSSGESGMEYLGDDRIDFHAGEHVRVIDGPFKGAEGYIHRIKRNRRLIVSVKGVCAVATSYIPQCFLQKIES